MAHEWVVGELYLGFNRNGLPVWTQPGGIGTLVYPQLPTEFPTNYQGYQQSPMSYPAQYFFSCGHPLNVPEIFEVYQPNSNGQVALVCCPMCSYIQQIIDPYTDFESYMDTPIIIA